MAYPEDHESAPRSLQELLTPGTTGLGLLLATVRELQRIEALLARVLDPAIAPHVRVAVAEPPRLVLLTPVAPLATRLRLDQAGILERLAGAGLPGFTELKIRVEPLPAWTANTAGINRAAQDPPR